MIKISIIIPVYNAESTLKQCVDSILTQEYRDFELLLIDDGSKDNSSAICDEYAAKDDRVRIFHKQNGGVSAARNFGIDKAKGEWITFVDSDDYIEDGYFEELYLEKTSMYVKTMKTFRDTNTNPYTVCGFENVEILDNARLKSFIESNISGFMLRAPWGKFFQRRLIDNLRFQEDMRVAEDACFVMNYLSLIDNLSLMPNGAYVVRLSPSPASVKYAITVPYAVQSLHHLQKAYQRLNERFQIGVRGFFSFIGSFKEMSQADWKPMPSKWYKNESIKNMYKYVWPDLSLKQKVFLLASFVFHK